MELTCHRMKLQPEFFDKIKSGQKKIEVRLFDNKRKEIKLGDIIEFKKEPEQTENLKTEVIELLNYKTFVDLINDFPITDFGCSNKEYLLKSLYNFYSKEDEDKYTVLGIKIRLTRN